MYRRTYPHKDAQPADRNSQGYDSSYDQSCDVDGRKTEISGKRLSESAADRHADNGNIQKREHCFNHNTTIIHLDT